MRLETELQSCRVAQPQSCRVAELQWSQVRSAQGALRTFLGALRQVVGAPDYERYLEHQAACHPGQAPLTPREYYADFVNRQFGSGPTRCC